jgi:hypothetical protein
LYFVYKYTNFYKYYLKIYIYLLLYIKMSDKLVFDLAQEVEGSPNVFIRKDWLNILDNQNQNYNNNQSIVDTSQLSNSNKYMSYREAYFLIPLLLTLVSTANDGFAPKTTPSDYAVGLKSWFGQIIHSFTLDYNGTTIVQQTPYVNMWNSFKLMTSLSYGDIITQGATIGFYPDDSHTWTWTPAAAAPDARAALGQGVCNNSNSINNVVIKNITNEFNQFASGTGNVGFAKRQSWVNYDACETTDGTVLPYDPTTYPTAYSDLLLSNECSNLWKSHIINKADATAATPGVLQIGVTACVYLKHIHSFFNMCPLLKGVFMKMTMNLNNTSTSFSAGWDAAGANSFLACRSVNTSYGGVNPGMIASVGTSSLRCSLTSVTNTASLTTAAAAINGLAGNPNDVGFYDASAPGVAAALGAAESMSLTNGNFASSSVGNSRLRFPNGAYNLLPAVAANAVRNYTYNISVGGRCLDGNIPASAIQTTTMSQSVYLYIPAYTFNPTFEQAYLSSPIKQIKYTDIYQYQVLNVQKGNQFNNLLTNGIANIKSVLILPYYSSNTNEKEKCDYNGTTSVINSNNSGFIDGIPVFQSPFDPAGTGPTSPLCLIKNFNVQVSGQNAIYNLEKYPFEQFNNQLYGQNAVNGGLTDGITSALIDREAFDMEYCYYYVNVERMLPVEMSVPKSVQILGTNASKKNVDLYCFIEYGVEISLDALTGARV